MPLGSSEVVTSYSALVLSLLADAFVKNVTVCKLSVRFGPKGGKLVRPINLRLIILSTRGNELNPLAIKNTFVRTPNQDEATVLRRRI
jgi:hypothetical protein